MDINILHETLDQLSFEFVAKCGPRAQKAVVESLNNTRDVAAINNGGIISVIVDNPSYGILLKVGGVMSLSQLNSE